MNIYKISNIFSKIILIPVVTYSNADIDKDMFGVRVTEESCIKKEVD